MSIGQIEERQGFLFTEPTVCETGVWCTLNDGIDPSEWAGLCRHIGKLSPSQFKAVKKRLQPDPDSLVSRFRRALSFKQCDAAGVPLVSIGPSGIGGQYQREK
ncbi:MAG: hypothetical protein KAS23_06480 [Anaerohalosphaera sp.]|nr:hypothetical protein [Anaerohalosphaera sp.]